MNQVNTCDDKKDYNRQISIFFYDLCILRRSLSIKKPAQNRSKYADTANQTESGINHINRKIGGSSNPLGIPKQGEQRIIAKNRKYREQTGKY